MIIQFNTDKTIKGDEKDQKYFTSFIAEELKRFETNISRIEVHLSDQNGEKEGIEDKLCLLEARIEGRKPIAVSCQKDTIETAVRCAIEKLKAKLDSIIGRIQDQEK